MNRKSRAVILHTTEYSNSSLIVKAYTEELGAASFIVSGVRKPKGRLSKNHFQPLSLLRLVYRSKPGTELHRINDAEFDPHFQTIPFDVSKSTMAMFLAEVLYRSVKEEEANEVLFNFIHTGICMLDACEKPCTNFHIAFLLGLSKYLGIYPSGNHSPGISVFDIREGVFTDSMPLHPDHTSVETAEFLNRFLTSGMHGFSEIRLTNTQKRDLLECMLNLYEIHQTHGIRIKSHEILHQVLHYH